MKCLGTEVWGEGGSYGEGSVAPGPVLGPEWWRQEAGIRGAEAVGRRVVVEKVGEVGGAMVMEGLRALHEL